MSDIIQLLPDSIANQIAAGEVVQRPASIVKELLENAVDAGADNVQLIIIDAGRTLIRVIDNGCGMSVTDARLSFERHATSKIRKADDLFAIQTKGFRGEALASIAAVAHVELKTKTMDNELGTLLEIEGSTVKVQEPCACPNGSSFSVKNMFYNVPARRQFLKSDSVETKHIIDEFERVALTHPDIAFEMIHNDHCVFKLPKATHRQRIVGVFGDKYNQRLVPVDETTNILNVFGFIGKPEFAKKIRGEQFLFVNNRYIRSTYLNHAITSAFKDLLSKKQYPLYLLYLEIDPAQIDVNIHPTKTEIKFRDEKSIYAIIHSTVKKSLGMFNVSPSLDFEQESSITIDPLRKDQPIREPQIRVDPNYNPFSSDAHSKTTGLASRYKDTSSTENWEELYKVTTEVSFDQERLELEEKQEKEEIHTNQKVFQLQKAYIVCQIKSGMIVIDQQRAHERILFEKFLDSLENNKSKTQKLLFPVTMELHPRDFQLLMDHLEEVQTMGIDVEEFGTNAVKLSGLPVYAKDENPELILEDLIGQLKISVKELELKINEKLALAMAKSIGIKKGDYLNDQAARNIVDELFDCAVPNYTPKGNSILYTIDIDNIKNNLA